MSTPYWGPDFDALASFDPDIAGVVLDELDRLRGGLQLIASENFTSPAVLAALGSTLSNKYAEGTVAVRLPDDDVARDLLRRTGPLAVSSANRSGRPAATTAQEAVEQLGAHAAVVLDGGPRAGSAPSTIVDCTGPAPRVLRVGAIAVDRLREVVPEMTD